MQPIQHLQVPIDSGTKARTASVRHPSQTAHLRHRTMIWLLVLAGLLLTKGAAIGADNKKKKTAADTLSVVGAVAGRLTFAEPLAQQFKKANRLFLRVHSGGSELGLQAVRDGFADIAMVSRSLTDEERREGLRDTLIAYDAIAVIVNKAHFLEEISLENLHNISTGKITSWKAFGGPDMPIRLLLPDTTSALRSIFLQAVLQGKPLRIDPQILPSTFQVIAALRSDTLALGICSATQARYYHLKTLRINGLELGKETVDARLYPFLTPMSLVTRGEPDERERLFLDWVLFGPAAELVAKNFYSPPLTKTAQSN